MDHFNSTIENLGDTLFGEDCNYVESDEFINALDDE